MSAWSVKANGNPILPATPHRNFPVILGGKQKPQVLNKLSSFEILTVKLYCLA